MRVRTAVLLMILVALGVFAALNWGVFTMPAELNLAFARVEAPLGVILLAVTVAVTILYLAFLAWLETAALLESRRYARELQVQRELAQNAEASRYSELKAFLAAELGELRAVPETCAQSVVNRLDRLEIELRADIERTGSTLAAYIDGLDEGLERRASSGAPAGRSAP